MYLGYGLDVFQINAIRWRRVERKLTSAAATAVRKTNKREEKETSRGQGAAGGAEGVEVVDVEAGSVERKIKQLARANRRVFN